MPCPPIDAGISVCCIAACGTAAIVGSAAATGPRGAGGSGAAGGIGIGAPCGAGIVRSFCIALCAGMVAAKPSGAGTVLGGGTTLLGLLRDGGGTVSSTSIGPDGILTASRTAEPERKLARLGRPAVSSTSSKSLSSSGSMSSVGVRLLVGAFLAGAGDFLFDFFALGAAAA